MIHIWNFPSLLPVHMKENFCFYSVIYTEQLREFFLSFTAYLKQHKAEQFYGITSSHS